MVNDYSQGLPIAVTQAIRLYKLALINATFLTACVHVNNVIYYRLKFVACLLAYTMRASGTIFF